MKTTEPKRGTDNFIAYEQVKKTDKGNCIDIYKTEYYCTWNYMFLVVF
jgi:hypothetical protein